RIVETMRLYLNAPIKYDRERNGYHYDAAEGEMFELPGIWFNASELHALLSVQQLLTQVQPGLLEQQFSPLKERIDQLLKLQHSGGSEITQRIRILTAAARTGSEHFQTIAGATAKRQRIAIDYYNRRDDQTSRRTLSPQRLTHYRDNWYLDAYCHLRNALRTFSMDAIHKPTVLQESAKEVSAEALDKHYSGAYGIFSGPATETAILRFTAERARWVACEQWHPQQTEKWLDDGRYELHIPYSQSPELLMDILKYGPDVEVVAPATLKTATLERLKQAADLYQ
ncbi:MAG: WYL domain-containing protein, partial [Candidatus Sedimenticola sp. (ex Thyasira tokunagai)]